MKKLLIALSLVLLLLVTAACSAPLKEASMPAPPPMPAPARMTPREFVQNGGGLPSASEERMIVRNGDISLVVEDVIKSRDEIARIAIRLGGFVVSSSISGEEQDRRGVISIRVPDDKFEQSLAELRGLAVRVTSESTSSRDVTEEYIDLQARLNNAEATESQYLALLDKAIDVEDILRIYDSLSRVRSEIEQLKGRMQYLERTSSMSLITVYLEPETSGKPLARAGWSALEVLKSAVRGLVNAGQILASIAIWLILFIPIWGTILGVILWRRHKKKRA